MVHTFNDILTGTGLAGENLTLPTLLSEISVQITNSESAELDVSSISHTHRPNVHKYRDILSLNKHADDSFPFTATLPSRR